jgi:two-component system sensor histidine kinase CiaH
VKLFESTTLKLTAWYLAIIMLISLTFSLILYQVSSNELRRGLPPGTTTRQLFIDPDAFETLRQQRITEANGNLISNLVLLNLVTAGLGGGASYFLAKRTLRPIAEAMEAQGRFTSDASHELRTPLTVMQTENEVALRNPNLSKSEMRALLESNLEEVNRLRALSDRLLELANGTGLDLKPVSVEEPAIEAVNRVMRAAQAKKVTVENNVAPLQILGDADKLADLLTILLDNAIKYSPVKTAITLSSEQRGRYVHLKVTDHGMGIKASDIPHIFDRFYRADISRTKQHIAGFGLGLSIAQRIAGLHQGTVLVTSTPGKGSVFTVKLPVDPSRSAATLDE